MSGLGDNHHPARRDAEEIVREEVAALLKAKPSIEELEAIRRNKKLPIAKAIAAAAMIRSIRSSAEFDRLRKEAPDADTPGGLAK